MTSTEMTGTEPTSTGLDVGADVNTHFTWDYTQRSAALTKLYEKGKTSQWNATTDIDWTGALKSDTAAE